MKQKSDIYKALVDDFNLFPNDLREWNINYFKKSRKRYSHILELIENNYKGGTILELGSLPCHLTYCLKKLNYPIFGLDIAPERATHFIKKNQLNVIKCNFEIDKLPFEDNHFKFILFMEVFEHMRIDPISTLKEINRVLHPEGLLIFTVPNLYSFPKIISYIRGKGFDDPYFEFNKINRLGHMGHVRDYSANQIKSFLKNTGFVIEKTIFKSYFDLNNLKQVFFALANKLFYKTNSIQIHIVKKKTL